LLSAVLFGAEPALAANWNGLVPGETKRADVLRQHGKPTRDTQRGRYRVLVYSGRQRIRGTRQVQFFLDKKTLKLRRIDVFNSPDMDLDRVTVEQTYGPRCSKPPVDKRPCYEQVRSGNTLLLSYATLGLRVTMSQDDRVIAVSYSRSTAAPQEAQPEKEDDKGKDRATASEETEPQPSEPSRDDLLAAPDVAPPADPPPTVETPDGDKTASQNREAEVFPPTQEVDSAGTTVQAEVDPLQIGAWFYSQALAAYTEGTAVGQTAVGFPQVLDVYLDGRPSEGIRAMAVGRLSFDPSLSSNGYSASVGTTQTTANRFSFQNPSVQLDQLWLNFNIAKQVFITLGQQHVKWGVGRLWNPTDFLSPSLRPVLSTFDQRLGISALKVHVPVESLNWNFYLLALLDSRGAADVFEKLGAAARAEFALGPTELAFSAVFHKREHPRFGIDASASLGPLDVYADVALTRPLANTMVRATGGVRYGLRLNQRTTLNVDAEYFYDATGAADETGYLQRVLEGRFDPFYSGRHYVGGTVGIGRSGDWSWSSSLTTLACVSDQSLISRADVGLTPPETSLSFNIFLAGHYGKRGGAFNFTVIVPEFTNPDGSITPVTRVSSPIVEAGLGFSVRY